MKDSDRKTYVADSASAFADAAHRQARVPAPPRHRRTRALRLRRDHAGRDPAVPGQARRTQALAQSGPPPDMTKWLQDVGEQVQGHEDPLHLGGDPAHHRRQPARQGRVHRQHRHRGRDRDRAAGAGAAEGHGRRPGPARRLRPLLSRPVLDVALHQRHRRSARALRPQARPGAAGLRLGRLLQAPGRRASRPTRTSWSASPSTSRSSS